jgi:hypothetical protein
VRINHNARVICFSIPNFKKKMGHASFAAAETARTQAGHGFAAFLGAADSFRGSPIKQAQPAFDKACVACIAESSPGGADDLLIGYSFTNPRRIRLRNNRIMEEIPQNLRTDPCPHCLHAACGGI